jgi:ketosteroid isomerase-like protein
VILLIVSIFWLPGARAQESLSAQEIPIQRCDGLPVIKVHINRADMSFLLDTASTTLLNLRSFPSGRAKPVPVTTWSGNSTANGREVILPEMVVGNHEFRDLKLPAVDLSTIEKACGNRIDGILGFDLLGKIGMTIDLKREVASFDVSPADVQVEFAEMERAMHPCNEAFNLGKVEALKNCLDPAIVLYTPAGEFRGREEVMDYLKRRYLRFATNVRFEMTPRDIRSFGDALWYSYDFTIESPAEHADGHGMAMCRRAGGQWRIVNMHNSPLQTDTTPKP